MYVDVAHTAPKPLVQVQDGIATLKHLLSVLNGGIRQNCAALLRLKGEMAQVCSLNFGLLGFFVVLFCLLLSWSKEGGMAIM